MADQRGGRRARKQIARIARAIIVHDRNTRSPSRYWLR